MHQIPNSFWLTGGWVALSADTAIQANLEVADGRIGRMLQKDPPHGPAIDLRDHLILPGLINAHDHLEFNLFPRLGNGPYARCEDWAQDIYQPQRSPLREHLSVPKTVRLWWGGLKNLLSGVTTVCHHNPYYRVFDEQFPVQVVQRYGWAHSIRFERDVAGAFASTGNDEPFIIHAGEGTDEHSRDEIFELDRIGVLSRRTILVHGVAFSQAGHTLRRDRGAALVWCPTSNRFTLGTTLDARLLGDFDRISLGSDSALTGQGNLLDEIRAAHEEGSPPDLLYRMITENAAAILLLNEGEGRIQPGAIANLIAIPWKQSTPSEAVTQLNLSRIEMVLVRGSLHLASREMVARWDGPQADGLEWISVEGLRRKVRAPIQWLIKEAASHLPDEIRLAGKRVSA